MAAFSTDLLSYQQSVSSEMLRAQASASLNPWTISGSDLTTGVYTTTHTVSDYARDAFYEPPKRKRTNVDLLRERVDGMRVKLLS